MYSYDYINEMNQQWQATFTHKDDQKHNFMKRLVSNPLRNRQNPGTAFHPNLPSITQIVRKQHQVMVNEHPKNEENIFYTF